MKRKYFSMYILVIIEGFSYSYVKREIENQIVIYSMYLIHVELLRLNISNEKKNFTKFVGGKSLKCILPISN